MAFIASALLALVLAAVAHAAGDNAHGVALATPFILPGDPDKTLNCCIAPWSITWFDQNAQIGECCAVGQSWTGNQTTLEGGCCDKGQDWSQDKASGLGGCCAPSLTFVGDRTTKTGGCCSAGMVWLNGKCVQSPPRPTCQDLADPVCGDGDDLGIQYGHCYILKFTDGTQLGSNQEGPAYSKDGYYKDIPFKVCRNTADCALGEPVPTDGTFVLQDQMGRPQDTKGSVGWVDNGAGGTHIKYNTNATKAGVFEGIPACSGGKCFIRLRRIGATCPMDKHGLTFWPNARVSIMMSFTETACSGPDAPFVPVTAANPAGLRSAFRAPGPALTGSNANLRAPVSQQASASLAMSATPARGSAAAGTVTAARGEVSATDAAATAVESAPAVSDDAVSATAPTLPRRHARA
ncbi:hypothetical protein EYR40_000156 [Pleurotus pulmonarius]|nr:hypothetical protein EYR36_001485 [Pleurotus pulmonarius]KAF4607820.1 hypothetical protein EYR40_000156 [Pleurotus pulmonarius]